MRNLPHKIVVNKRWARAKTSSRGSERARINSKRSVSVKNQSEINDDAGSMDIDMFTMQLQLKDMDAVHDDELQVTDEVLARIDSFLMS